MKSMGKNGAIVLIVLSKPACSMHFCTGPQSTVEGSTEITAYCPGQSIWSPSCVSTAYIAALHKSCVHWWWIWSRRKYVKIARIHRLLNTESMRKPFCAIHSMVTPLQGIGLQKLFVPSRIKNKKVAAKYCAQNGSIAHPNLIKMAPPA
jgi:hypothetical protein